MYEDSGTTQKLYLPSPIDPPMGLGKFTKKCDGASQCSQGFPDPTRSLTKKSAKKVLTYGIERNEDKKKGGYFGKKMRISEREDKG